MVSLVNGTTVKGGVALSGEIARHRAPQNAAIDFAAGKIVDHGLRRGIRAGVDEQRVGLGMAQQAVDRHVGAGRRLRDDADPLVLELGIVDRGDTFKTAAGLEHQRIGRPVIGNCDLRLIVALRKSHDGIAAERAQRHPDEAGRLREVGVAELLAEFGGEQFGELVFESLALVVGERQIARIATGPKHIGIDKFERTRTGIASGLGAGSDGLQADPARTSECRQGPAS